LTGLLDPARVDSLHYFGGTKFRDGKMATFLKTELKLEPGQKPLLEAAIAALSAEAKLTSQQEIDARDASRIEEGRKHLAGRTLSCTDCHKFHEAEGDDTAPDLTGYGSRAWLKEFISSPEHERFYGERNDRMPSFGTEKMLTEQEIGLVADWLRGEWYTPEKK
ncbi:MAG: c-type cytochrome, partial [Opitutaceae bacterium]